MPSDRPWMVDPCPYAVRAEINKCTNKACPYCGDEYVPPVSVDEADIIARAYCKKFDYRLEKYESPEGLMAHAENDVMMARDHILRGQSKWMVEIFKAGQQSVVNQAKDPRSDLPYCAVCDLRHDLPMHKPQGEES